MNVELRATLRDLNGGAKISKKNAEKLGIIPGDVIIIEESITGTTLGAIVSVDPSIPDDVVYIDRAMAKATGLIEDAEVIVSRYNKPLRDVNQITLGVIPESGLDASKALLNAREFRGDLKKILSGKLIFNDATFWWDRIKAHIKVLSTSPPLNSDEFALYDAEKGLDKIILTSLDKLPFNGVLMIDFSKSMLTKDMLVKDILRITALKDYQISNRFDKIVKGIKSGESIERWRAAVLAALLYMVSKVAHGYGEKVAVIPFSSKAEILKIGGSDWFDSRKSKDLTYLVDRIIDESLVAPFGTTNIADALRLGLNIAKKWEKDKSVMFVLLTDGFPDDYEDTLNAIEEVSREKNIVVFAFGIGNTIDEELLNYLAERTNGEFFKVQDFDSLANIYASLAEKLNLLVNMRDEQLKTKKQMLIMKSSAMKRSKEKNIDIAFVIDSTGSMSDDIDAVKSCLKEILTNLQRKVQKLGAKPNIRFSLILYKDHPPEDFDYVTKIQAAYEKDFDKIIRRIEAIEVGGGGDGPEAVADGLKAAYDLKWNIGYNLVLLLGDAPPHGFTSGDRWDSCPAGHDPIEIAKKMAEHKIFVYTIATDNYAASSFKKIASAAGEYGRFISLEKDRALLVKTLTKILNQELVGVITLDELILQFIIRGGVKITSSKDLLNLTKFVSNRLGTRVTPLDVYRRIVFLTETNQLPKNFVTYSPTYNELRSLKT